MEKKGLIVFLFIIFSIILNLKLIYAAGISPAVVHINFEPGLERKIVYGVYQEDADRGMKITITGNLAEYAQVDKDYIVGPGSFTVTLKLPQEISSPGKNRIGVRVTEEAVGGGLGTATSVESGLYILVPYPGKYAEISGFSAADVNTGEDIPFHAEISSLGKEGIFVDLRIDVSVSEGKEVDSFVLGQDYIDLQQTKEFDKKINSEKYGPGEYNSTLTLNYGDPERKPTKVFNFRIGSLFVDILNWTKEIYSNNLNKFDIEIKSNWNNEIENIYAIVSVYDPENKTNILTEFKTTSEGLGKWETKVLVGYLDTTNILPGVYKTNMTLYYEEASTERIVNIIVKRKISIFLIVSTTIGILLILVLIIFIILRKRKKKK